MNKIFLVRNTTAISEAIETDWADVYRRRQRFYALLNYLKKEGLVDNKKSKGHLFIWSITKKGKE